MARPIRSIDDLAEATRKDIAEAKKALDLRKIINMGLHKRATQPGLTLKQYNAKVKNRKPRKCRVCDGTGIVMPPKPRTVGVIHPSSANSCRLRLYHDIVGDLAPVQQMQAPLMVVFAIGHAIHDLVQTILTEDMEEGTFVAEPRIDMNEVQGNTDGLIDLGPYRAVLEIKSDGPSKFPNRKGPDADHIVQATGLYATALDAPFTVFLYIEKVWPHAIKQYIEVYDPLVFAKWLRTKGEPAIEGAKKGVPPVADASPAECGRCCYAYEGGCAQNLSRSAPQAFVQRR